LFLLSYCIILDYFIVIIDNCNTTDLYTLYMDNFHILGCACNRIQGK